jgi:predicted MFS family arabinose efflux permease
MIPFQFGLVLLALGAFTIGTDCYLVAGILPNIAADLSVPVATAGQLVSIFAIAYAVAAPLMSANHAGITLGASLGGLVISSYGAGPVLVVAAVVEFIVVAALITGGVVEHLRVVREFAGKQAHRAGSKELVTKG